MSEAQDKLLQGEMNMTLNMAMMTSARDAVGKCLATLGGEYDNMLVPPTSIPPPAFKRSRKNILTAATTSALPSRT